MTAAIEELKKKRDELIAERDRNFHEFQKRINQLDSAIDTLCGKTVWDSAETTHYDDENPNYIKGSFEEM